MPPADVLVAVDLLLLDRNLAGFVGRAQELAALDVLARQRPALGVLSGAGGVGKTALALHWARTRSPSFPAGVTYVDLDCVRRGPELGQYRGTITGRRLLILDNVREAAHVRMALPADPKVMVLAISRDALPGLAMRDHAHQIPVEPLPMDDAVKLLEAVAGVRMPGFERLASRCDRLPLALRIMGSSLTQECEEELSLPAWEFGAEDRGVWVALDVAYRRLDPDAARVLRILATLAVWSVSISGAASVCGLSEAEAGRALAILSCRQLTFVDPFGGKGYGMHDLVRLYALDRASRLPVAPRFPGTKEKLEV